jgi:hypothetical protein
MTEEQEVAHFGVKVPEKYCNFVLGQKPLWSLEHFKAALAVAEKYGYNPDVLDADKEPKVQ